MQDDIDANVLESKSGSSDFYTPTESYSIFQHAIYNYNLQVKVVDDKRTSFLLIISEIAS
jgi:hypothetical protein